MHNDAGGNTPCKERESINHHAPNVDSKHGVLQPKQQPLNNNGNHNAIAVRETGLQPTAINDFFNRRIEMETVILLLSKTIVLWMN